MCTNTHEWCAEGIKPEIDGQQTCNLADLVEFIIKHQDYREIRDFMGEKVCAITGAQHFLIRSTDGSRAD